LIFIREVRGAISETDIDWFFPVLLGKWLYLDLRHNATSLYYNFIINYLYNTSSDSYEIPRTSWKPYVHYHVHNSQTFAPTLSQIDAVHAFSYHLS
jgi:hypothetical protein